MKRILLLILLLCLPVAALADWPELDMPDDARSGSVGSQVRMNGVPMRVYGLQFNRSFAEMKLFYKAELRKTNFRSPTETPAENGGVTLFQHDGRYLISVNLSPQTSNSSTATIIISDPQNTHKSPYEFPLPSDSQVLSDVESIDEGQYSRHLTISNPHSYVSFKNDLLRRLSHAGYSVEADMHEKIKGKKKVEVFYFKAEGRDAKLTVSEQPGASFAELILVRLR